MPTYEYQCNGCQRVFEVRQRISEPPLTTCETCGGEVRRLLSPAPFILKGGGWYVTDYPSEARKQGMNAEKSSASDKSDKTKSDKTEKSDTSAKADAPAAAAPKSDGAGSASPSGASSTAAKPAD